jgi:tRNA dimethylallyltransferase
LQIEEPSTPKSQMSPTDPPLIVLLGPTAVGKTELSLALCEQFHGEIISADSRQIYRGMDIGTAKPTPAERMRAPHHLIDIRAPDETLTVAEYQALAYTAIDDIHQRGRLPILVGGTALYIRAIIHGLRVPEVPPNPALRTELETLAATQGAPALFARLQVLDPKTAAVIDRHNPRRLVRALEIVLSTGQSKVDLERAIPPPYRILCIGLDRPRPALYARIDQRVDHMIAQGLVEETRQLLAAGYRPPLPAVTSLGYREIIAYLAGEVTLAEAVARIKTETHRYARYQYTAFRKLPDIHWFDLEQTSVSEIAQAISAFLNR